MEDITLIATQGSFGPATDRVAALATQGFFEEVGYVAPKILDLQISIRSSGSQIGITRRNGIQIRSSRSHGDPRVV